MAQTTVANYEQGTRFPDARLLTAIADSFDVSLDYLFGRTDDVRSTAGPAAADRYVELLIKGKGEQAAELALDASRRGRDVRALYERLLTPALEEIGRLWEVGRIDVAQEHYATGVTRSVMERLRAGAPPAAPNGHAVVCVSAGGDHHDLGLRMVADYFAMDGWAVHYLGALVPIADVVAAVAREGADLLALSVTLPSHAEDARALAAAVAADGRARVLVGGRAFAEEPRCSTSSRAAVTPATPVPPSRLAGGSSSGPRFAREASIWISCLRRKSDDQGRGG